MSKKRKTQQTAGTSVGDVDLRHIYNIGHWGYSERLDLDPRLSIGPASLLVMNMPPESRPQGGLPLLLDYLDRVY